MTSQAIADMIHAPAPYLQRTLMYLVRANIIKMRKGPGGGYYTTPDQYSSVKVLDIFTALGYDMSEKEGSRGSDKLSNAFFDMLNVTLEDFFV
jgi:DNA-binding IscR family transcriptional regulator